MSITPVQSVKGYSANSGTVDVNITPTAGNCLILSVGMYSSNYFWGILREQNLPFTNFVTDNQNNEWIFVGISPVQIATTPNYLHSAVATFISTGVAGAATAISVQTIAQYVEVMVDEFSGVATVAPVDDSNFNSTAYGSGLSSIASGNITVTGTELVYSVGFADLESETLTASSGFIQIQTDTNLGVTMSTFYKNVTGGTSSNTISASSPPGSLHVLVFGLSPVSVSSIVVQNAYMIDGGTVVDYAIAPFTYPNTAGNLLVLRAYLYERGTATISDTQGNNWVVAITPPGGSTNIVMAYCLSAIAGPNTVTLNTGSGGTDDVIAMLVTEFSIQGAQFNASSVGNNTTPGNSVNTGNITVTGKSLLVSMAASDSESGTFTSLARMGSSPETWRLQPSDGFGTMQCIADQVVTSAGSYSNTFTASSSTNDLYSGILGFNIPSIALACPTNSGGILGQPYSGQLIVIGGVPPFVFAIISGGLPPGITLNTSSGLISGTPTAAGSYPYEAKVTDSLNEVATANCIITIPNSGLSSGAMTSCGCMPSLEITLDNDADWADQDTFFITQDVPFPFTLRGLILRQNYEND
jgi:hypothetical protein